MNISPSDKALLISMSSACLLILVFFFLGVKPYDKDLAEEFIEIPVIAEVFPEEQELEEQEMIDTGERLSNQAYDVNKLENESKAFEDDDIRKAIEEKLQQSVQDLNADNDARLKALKEEQEKAAELKKQQIEEEIAAREAKRSEKKMGKSSRSTISYNLIDRTAIELPNPVYTCDAVGKVVINIMVNSAGKIIKKSYNKSSSTSTNGCLIDQAILYLEDAHFNSSSKKEQLGTVTFIFQG